MTTCGTTQTASEPVLARDRSLVTVAPALPVTTGVGAPHADFVMQIIACACDVPAFRRARREEPGLASQAYGVRRKLAAHEFDVSF